MRGVGRGSPCAASGGGSPRAASGGGAQARNSGTLDVGEFVAFFVAVFNFLRLRSIVLNLTLSSFPRRPLLLPSDGV